MRDDSWQVSSSNPNEMAPMLTPLDPLPEPLRANEEGTFTQDSVVRRLPEIARRIAAENGLDPDQAGAVETLAVEIGDGYVTPLDEPEAEDAAAWVAHVEPYAGMTWIDAPWFFIETYFYRRMLAATGYSQPGPRQGVDPFLRQKQIALDGAVGLAARLGGALDDTRTLIAAALWANRVDLSLWPADGGDADSRIEAVLGSQGVSRLLVDDTDAVLEVLNGPEVNVHIVLDNAGAELIADLALVTNILRNGGRVTIHAKPHPTFVSDVTLPDLDATIQRLAAEPNPAHQIARAISTATGDGALQVTTHPFWVSPGAGWLCPPDLVENLSEADLIIFKGDANYRRLLGDLHWDPTTPIDRIIRPPQPLLALRTAKAEVVAGLTPEVVRRAAGTDPAWISSGEWGLVQYVEPEA